MTRLRIAAFFDRVERQAADTPRAQRLMLFMQAITEDRILQASVAVAAASLWFTLAFGDGRFLVLLPAAVIAFKRFRRLERDFVPEEDDDWL